MEKLETFKKYFENYRTNYVLIGGTACSILMDEVGLDFRSTKDFDMILIIENLDKDFAKVFWKFIKDGEYRGISQGETFKNFYRFEKPNNTSYPAMIELFSRATLEDFKIEETVITPLHISDEVSSLSAIILDQDYYEALINGQKESLGVTVLSPSYLILFKAKAWLDLTERKNQGLRIDSKDIDKHRKDILRLHSILEPDEKVHIGDRLKEDIREFLKQLEIENKNIDDLKLDYPLSEIIDELSLRFLGETVTNLR